MVSLLNDNFGAWEKRYIRKEKVYETPYLRFGKRTSELLDGTIPMELARPDEYEALSQFTKLEISEMFLPVNLEGLPIVGVFDTCDRYLVEVGEYKTGLYPWTQHKVQQHGQMWMYALIAYLLTGRLPERMWLEWAETVEENGWLFFTGRVEHYDFHPHMEGVTAFAEWLIGEAIRISQIINAFAGRLTDVLDYPVLEEYGVLYWEQKDIKARMDEFKPYIEEMMVNAGLSHFRTKHGLFSFTTRSSWEYSDDVNDLERILKEQKEYEQANGIAIETLTSSLAYRSNRNRVV